MSEIPTRPHAVTGLVVFFALGAAISSISCLSLLFPGGPLEPMWQLNPRAREAFQQMGLAGPILLASVAGACAWAAVGLWRGSVWGYRIAVTLFVINLLGDVANAFLGVERRALIGIPIVVALLVYLARGSVRRYFR